MSSPKESGPGPHGAQDDVDYGKVILVGVLSLVLFAASIAWSTLVWKGTIKETEAATGKAREVDTSQKEIGIVDQVPFVSDKRLPEWRAARKHDLTTYGWVDRSKNLVHIPIEAAMDKIAGGAMPAGAPK